MKKKQYIGKVVSNKMQKTLVILVPKYKKVSFYLKKIKVFKKFFVHNDTYENSEIFINDIVLFEQFKPLSKKKRWILKKKIY